MEEKKRKEKMEKRNDKENVSLVYVWRQGGEGKKKYIYIFIWFAKVEK